MPTCRDCEYELDGLLLIGARVRCPECGLVQNPQSRIGAKPWPGWRLVLWHLCGMTLMLGAACVLALGAAPDLGAALAPIAILTAVLAPITVSGYLSTVYDMPRVWRLDPMLGLVFVGWAGNLLIGVCCLTLAAGLSPVFG